MSGLLARSHRTTLALLLLVAFLSVGVIVSSPAPATEVARARIGPVLLETNVLQVIKGACGVIISGAAVVGLTVVPPVSGVALAAGFVGAWVTGIDGGLTIWEGLGRPGW